ncbi:hypothetical protein COT42_01095 [Candidatus Saganbacteria bacterium CG08_land_8_20_14_0_20_45_16]|uniref:Protein kinase domain-containing protein n=1 Tax=Candidatus Saganbacteria bacterium CG08_land_8_20_14_0_20_45_16 TaxID=2014293 RepID=A0A2H0Y3I7_UNCSA|nr:MAG: hypothetical protein COT42_01095 [Candidatus Saganbacteria bacterium CG08_land_8_20_14_0_20_45_16]
MSDFSDVTTIKIDRQTLTRRLPPTKGVPSTKPKPQPAPVHKGQLPDTDELEHTIELDAKGLPLRHRELMPGEAFYSYTITKLVKRGGEGTVYTAINQRGEKVVIKVAHPNRLSALVAEVIERGRSAAEEMRTAILERLPGALVLKHIDGLTLNDYFKLYPEHRSPSFILRLINHIDKKLRQHQRAHGDVSMDNIFLVTQANGSLKVELIDPGAAKWTRTSLRMGKEKITGSPLFMAPETACGKLPTEKVDVYALGILLAMLLCQKKPFPKDQTPEGTKIESYKDFAFNMRAQGKSFVPPLTKENFIQAVNDKQTLGEEVFNLFNLMTAQTPDWRIGLYDVTTSIEILLATHDL